MRNLAEVLASGQPAARQLVHEVPTAIGTTMVTAAGYLVDGNALTPVGGVRRIGEDSRAVCGELGLAADEIETLIADGVLREPPGELIVDRSGHDDVQSKLACTAAAFAEPEGGLLESAPCKT